MALRNALPIRFTARGLSDAFDATDTFLGACRDLNNLLFDRDNPEVLVPRPGVTPITSFPGFNTPGFISMHNVVEPRVYGTIATARNGGKDEPFCYDNLAGAFVTINGVTNANSPSSPASAGAWTPPTMAVIGTKIIVTHPGFSGAPGIFFGVIDLAVFGVPVWSAANTTGNALPSVPLCVANFTNRAYFACGNTLYWSDNLAPTVITNANQNLIIGDSTPIIALSGQPIQTSSGGVSSALYIFKKSGQIWQLIGDQALATLFLSPVSLTIGTGSPRSIVQVPEGTYFAGGDGPYVISLNGNMRPLEHSDRTNASDVSSPFRNAITPSRVAGNYVSQIYRICMDTINKGVSVSGADYWFDTRKRRWNGIHSFAYDCIDGYQNYFILSSAAFPGILFKSQAYPDSTSVYTDNGAGYTCLVTSSSMPKVEEMSEKQIVESTIELTYLAAPGVSYTVSGLDDQGATLDAVAINTYQPGSLWGGFLWGVGLWSSVFKIPHVFNIPWEAPLVFQKFSLQVSVPATQGVGIGTAYMRYQKTRYTNVANA